MKTKIKIQPTTRQKYSEFLKMSADQGYLDGGRYGWGFSPDEKKIVNGLKDDMDIVILRMPPEEIGKFDAIRPNIVISDKYKYITTVSDEQLDSFSKLYLPNIEIVK